MACFQLTTISVYSNETDFHIHNTSESVLNVSLFERIWEHLYKHPFKHVDDLKVAENYIQYVDVTSVETYVYLLTQR